MGIGTPFEGGKLRLQRRARQIEYIRYPFLRRKGKRKNYIPIRELEKLACHRNTGTRLSLFYFFSCIKITFFRSLFRFYSSRIRIGNAKYYSGATAQICAENTGRATV